MVSNTNVSYSIILLSSMNRYKYISSRAQRTKDKTYVKIVNDPKFSST